MKIPLANPGPQNDLGHNPLFSEHKPLLQGAGLEGRGSAWQQPERGGLGEMNANPEMILSGRQKIF